MPSLDITKMWETEDKRRLGAMKIAMNVYEILINSTHAEISINPIRAGIDDEFPERRVFVVKSPPDVEIKIVCHNMQPCQITMI